MERHSSTRRHHDNRLWREICDLYRHPGVATACLALQDGWQADVCLLLSCRRLAASDAPPRWDALLAISAVWQARLRRVRALRRVPIDHPRWPRLRALLLRLELAAERCEIAQIQQCLPKWRGAEKPASHAAVTRTLRAYALAAALPPDALAALDSLAALLEETRVVKEASATAEPDPPRPSTGGEDMGSPKDSKGCAGVPAP